MTTPTNVACSDPLAATPSSACCNAPMSVGGAGITHYYECTKCGNPCDPYSPAGTDPWTGQPGDGFADTRIADISN